MGAPATIDGGDLIVMDWTILVGATDRTSSRGVRALADLVRPIGYRVQVVPVDGCLHLKTAATAPDPDTLVAYRPFVDLAQVDAKVIEVDPDEPQGANVVRVGEVVLADASAPRTIERLRSHGYDVVALDVSEFAKAEGAISCKSVVFNRP